MPPTQGILHIALYIKQENFGQMLKPIRHSEKRQSYPQNMKIVPRCPEPM
jgi:hypothetical protein